jgi:large subunit ribosomal protein L6
MSIIGKQPINIPDSVTVTSKQKKVEVKGPLGSLDLLIPEGIKIVNQDGKQLKVERNKDTKRLKSIHGTIRNLIQNMITGVLNGWEKKLEVKGTGYGVQKQGEKVVFKLGYSHPVEFDAPEGIGFEVDKNVVTVKGINKELVGNTAAKIRRINPPNIYHGKGIRYLDEHVKLKPGKVAKVGGAGGIGG